MSSSGRAWRRWGKSDPYYGVLTDDRFRKESIKDTRSEFFETGEWYIAARLSTIEQSLGPIAYGRALDFGCGVGRLTLPLARRFVDVVGLDISSAMLDEAKAEAWRTGVANAEFLESDDRLSRAVGSFDFVHTYIVLQHIEVAQGMSIIGSLADRVAMNGLISLHFSVYRKSTTLGKISYWLKRYAPGYFALANLKGGRRWSEPLMQMNEYPLHRVIALLEELGFGPSSVETEIHAGVLTALVCARRLTAHQQVS